MSLRPHYPSRVFVAGQSPFAPSIRCLRTLFPSVLGLAFVATAAGQTLPPRYSATVGVDPYDTLTNKGPTAVEATLNSSVPIGMFGSDTKNQFAAAGPSGLRASARVTLTASYSGKVASLGDGSDVGLADAVMRLDDLRFRGINGDRSGTTTVPLHLDLSGTFLGNVNAFSDSAPGSFAKAAVSEAVQVTVTVPDVIFGGTAQAQEFSYFQSRDSLGNIEGSLFDSLTVTTQPFKFYNGVDNKMTVELFTRVTGEAGGIAKSFDAIADSLADFSHTLTFAKHGPVFDLPEGYSANSAEAQIIGNSFLLAGDANGDGIVNFKDLLILAQHYGLMKTAMRSDGDFNGDGAVGFEDLLILAQHYQSAATPTVPVPEPSNITLFALAAILVHRRRRGALIAPPC